MDDADIRVMLVELKAAVAGLAESVNLKLDRLGDRIDTGDNRTMQALLLTDERLSGLAGRHAELSKRVDQTFESLGIRLDQQRDRIESLDVSRGRLYGLISAFGFVAAALGTVVGHVWH